MVTTQPENRQTRGETADIVGRTRHFVQGLAEHDPGLGAAVEEGAAIADIVAPLGLGAPLVAAALADPVARAGGTGPEALERAGLGELAAPVTELLQLGRFRLPPDWQPGEALAVSQSEALRKMLLALVSDPRIVVIRIAEQLHRMRHARAAAPEEQRALAIETREIFAALANRLGIWQLKWELEDLAFRFLEPEQYARIARALNEKRAEREAVIESLRRIVAAELAKNDIPAEVTGRPKHIYSIWRKMQRKNRGLEQIFDVTALRVLVPSVRDCYAALGVVHNRWSWLPGEFDDYIANPKQNDYRSLHTAVIGPGGRVMEVQIRTHEMHRQAELGVAAHWRYKVGTAPSAAFDQKIRMLRQIFEPTGEDGDLLEQLRGDVFEDRVYAFSPKGDVVEMPAGATPLDFAYHEHTEIGHRCRGARENRRIVPLTTTVKNGDRIEIITGKEPQPSRDWLSPLSGYLVSPRSRAKVRSWFRQQDRDQNRRQGREILDRELVRLNLKDVAIETIAERLRQPDVDALYVALGAGDVTPAALARALQQLRGDEPQPDTTLPRPAARPDAPARRFAIRGVDDLLCNLARCCRPVAPEDIAGYITKGRGVSIHRKDCGNFANLQSRHPERVIEVEWGAAADATFAAELVVQAYDRQGLLRDVLGVLVDEKVGVTASSTRTDRQRLQATIELEIAVPGLAALSRVISRIEQLPNVTSVRRRT